MATECKGTNMVAALKTLRARHGETAVHGMLARIPGEDGDRLRSASVLVGSWYPVAVWSALLDQVHREFSYVEADMQALGFATVEGDLAGMYRLLVKLLTPEMLLGWGPKTFGQYYRGGKLSVRHVAPGVSTAWYEGWHGFTAPIWHTVAGGSCAALRACGAKFAEGRVEVKPGSYDMLLTLHWAT